MLSNARFDTNASSPRLKKPVRLVGSQLVFRNAEIADAEFILSLRLDPAKNEHLSTVSPRLEDQIRWLGHYETDESQVYFIIMDLSGRNVGTVRMYDATGFSFCWGSWILSDEAPKSSATESAIMIYHLGMKLGFTASHFDVRRRNEKVWQFHERLGARRLREDDKNFYYQMDTAAIEIFLEKYSDRIPNGVSISF